MYRNKARGAAAPSDPGARPSSWLPAVVRVSSLLSASVPSRDSVWSGRVAGRFADDQSMSVTDGSGRTVDTDQARLALRTQLGAELPWTHLRYWMLGVPSPGEPSRVADAGAAPDRVIDQSGWRIDYDTFRAVSGSALPAKFTATRDVVRLEVVIDDWSVATGTSARP